MLEAVKIEPAANLPYKNAPAKFRGTELVEAAGIEHFAKFIKSISYKADMPKSCPGICVAFRVMDHRCLLTLIAANLIKVVAHLIAI